MAFFLKPHTGDACDLALDPDREQYIVWGVGGLGETAFKHFIRANGNTGAHTHHYTCGEIVQFGYIGSTRLFWLHACSTKRIHKIYLRQPIFL